MDSIVLICMTNTSTDIAWEKNGENYLPITSSSQYNRLEIQTSCLLPSQIYRCSYLDMNSREIFSKEVAVIGMFIFIYLQVNTHVYIFI